MWKTIKEFYLWSIRGAPSFVMIPVAFLQGVLISLVATVVFGILVAIVKFLPVWASAPLLVVLALIILWLWFSRARAAFLARNDPKPSSGLTWHDDA